MASQDNDKQFCWEQVSESNRLFRISHLFVPEQFADPLLALYALFASIDQISTAISEEQVARRKLDWWLCELQPLSIATSRHPVVRHLNNSGVAGTLSTQSIELLFSGAEARLNMQAPSNTQELRSLCELIYQPRIHMDYAACSGLKEALPDFRAASINGGLMELLWESSYRSERSFWWVPLHFLAHFGISRRELEQNPDSAIAQALFRQVFEENSRLNFEETAVLSKTPPGLPGELHIRLLAALKLRQLDRLSKQRPSLYSVEMGVRRVSDVFAAWRLTRMLNGSLVRN
jgi:hypothetical protein